MNENIVSGKYIKFVPAQPNPKTKVWSIRDETNIKIGSVSWFGRWRKYCFFPGTSTVWEQVCLREVANFCENQTKLHKEDK